MKVIKVVLCSFSGKMHSSSVKNEMAVEYVIGSKTLPKEGFGPLTAFSDIHHAKNFVGWIFRYVYKFLECECVESKADSVWGCGVETPKNMLPKGTVLCDEITPLREIEVKSHDTLLGWIGEY